jgi:hypothetical protein
VPVRFTPSDNIFKGEALRRSQYHFDRSRTLPGGGHWPAGGQRYFIRWYPEPFQVRKMETLLGDEPTLQAIQEDKPLAEIRGLWTEKTEEFKARREKYLLYPSSQDSTH